jgi:hypothetical protein
MPKSRLLHLMVIFAYQGLVDQAEKPASRISLEEAMLLGETAADRSSKNQLCPGRYIF